MRLGSMMCATTALWCPALATAQGPAAEADAPDILVVGERRDLLRQPAPTASRLGLTPLETPATVNTVPGDEIRLRGDLDLVAAVTRAPGITSAANPGNGGTALAARGFNGQGSVLQLVDGIRLFPVAGTVTFPTDPWMVERVEVLNGPASVLYGQGALGGAVNYVSRQPNRDRTVVEGEAGYGSQHTARVAAGIGGPATDTLSYRADVSFRRSNGYVDRGRSRSLSASGAVRWQPADGFFLQLRNDYGRNRPTRYFGTPLIEGRIGGNRFRNYNVADASLHYRDNHTLLTAEWQPADGITIRNDAYRLTSKRLFKDLEQYCYIPASGQCRNGGNAGSDLFDPAPPGTVYRFSNLGIVHDQTQYGDQGTVRVSTPLGGGLTNDLVAGFDVNAIRLTYSHDFPPGADYQEDVVDPFAFDPGAYFNRTPIVPRYKTRTREYAFFAEDRLKLGAFSLTTGIRYEHDAVRRRNLVYAADGSVTEANAFPGGQTEKTLRNTTYRVGGLVQPTPDIALYVQYTTGVDPLGTLTTYTTSGTQFAFTNAKGDQVEAGAKASFLGGRGSATLAAYRIVKQNLVAQRTPTSPIEQIGQRSAKGLEASVTVALPRGFSVDANGTVLDADYDDFISGGTSFTGRTPANIPQSAANLWLRWTGGRIAAQAGLRYVGKQYSDDANAFRVPAYAVVDLGASYAITPALAMDLRLSNLGDRKYVTTTYDNEQWLLGRPRSVDVSLRARF